MKAIWTRALLACSLATLAVACGGDKPAPAASTAPAATMAKAPAATTAAPAAPATVAAAPAAGSVGIPECDEYITKYEACLNDHVPAASKAQMQAVFDQARASWKTAAANAESRPGLARACKQTMDAAKAATTFYGCKW